MAWLGLCRGHAAVRKVPLNVWERLLTIVSTSNDNPLCCAMLTRQAG